MGVFLVAIFTAIADFFLKYFTAKVAGIAALIATMATLTGTLYLSFNGLLSLIAVSLPPSLAWAISLLPSNLPTCLATIVSAKASKWVYLQNIEIAKNLALTAF